ncbi:craniofacial development protein 2-like [Ischnura elegans]|uniref:craniofacial development protein 2-like n=1 Tax=Ischnura elegans TaxID=197161 RepID=UPI001ED86E99|nr:craniofacial development protein 2-like [Ischnura elegans]
MTGRSRELASALKTRPVDIACVQETKWKGAKAKEIGEGYKLYYDGTRSNQNGVGIIVKSNLFDNVVEVTRISEHIMSIKINASETTLRVISCYAPQPGCPDDIKEEFWDQLDDHIRSVGPDEHLVIDGDLNAHVGFSCDGYEHQHCGCGYGARNDHGIRILDCAEAHDFAVANTSSKRRQSHLLTYASGTRASQIDDWKIRRRDHKLVDDVKVIPSDNVAPQHRPLVIDLRLDIRQHRRGCTTGPAHIKWWRLNYNKNQLKIALDHLSVNPDQPVAGLWHSVANQIQEAACEVLG